MCKKGSKGLVNRLGDGGYLAWGHRGKRVGGTHSSGCCSGLGLLKQWHEPKSVKFCLQNSKNKKPKMLSERKFQRSSK